MDDTLGASEINSLCVLWLYKKRDDGCCSWFTFGIGLRLLAGRQDNSILQHGGSDWILVGGSQRNQHIDMSSWKQKPCHADNFIGP